MLMYITHPDCQCHDNGCDHPENAQRYAQVEDALHSAQLMDYILYRQARQATDEDILRVHTPHFLETLKKHIPQQGLVSLDEDTGLSPQSLESARYASGAVLTAVDALMQGEAQRAFCNVRPPGHHAEVQAPMGFCIVNNVAIGAAYAKARYDLNKIAILDIDVHHGNGTESYVRLEPSVYLVSNFQTDLYPFTRPESDLINMYKIALPAQTTGDAWLAAWQGAWQWLDEVKPELIFVSAGFDGHSMDPMANWQLHETDYGRWTQQLIAYANCWCQGRVISVLEGGYNLTALGLSVRAHVKVLAELT